MKLILCFACAEKYVDENGEPDKVLLAMFGSQGAENDDETILVTKAITEIPAWWREKAELTTLPCDGCGTILSVSRSSEWFLQQRAENPPLKIQ